MNEHADFHPTRWHRSISLLLAGILGCLPVIGLGDTLSELPQPWQGRLQPIAEADLSGAEPYARKVIANQRSEVARLLSDETTADPDLAEGFGRLGAFYQVFQLASAARTSYRNAMTLAPTHFRWAYYAGYHSSQMGQHEEAIRLYKLAQGLQPDYSPLSLRLAESWLELSRLDEASSALKSVAKKPGLRALALYHLAQIDLLQRRYDQAIEKLEEVLRLDTKADQAHYPLARAWRAKGENARSREHMDKHGKRLPEVDDPMIKELQDLNQGARRFFAQGLHASQTREFTSAAEAFAQGLEIEPENNHARVSYARALFLAGQADQAARELEAVLQREPEHDLALFLSGILQEHDGAPTAAVARYQRVLKQDPDHYGAHFCLANRLFQDGEYGAAASHYRTALAANPEIPPARLHELLALKLSGQSDAEIVKRLETLAISHPEQQILGYTLIRMLLLSEEDQVRDQERARQLVNELVQQAFIPPHVELQALVAAAMGNFEQAAMLQQQVLPTLHWMGTEIRQQAEDVLAAYQRQELPMAVWYRDNRLLQPPANDARLMFREYPSAVPY